ncbi:hypothetical protein J2I47_03570 [Fibrella sp. HMF5335]|uniref:Oxygen tolerance n=1 Tax=Fibrella rubiginis TaxID=2817060 RepID=A0A939K1U4_9BACT|nr:hypothetical protein [Fibrella rubiginis]MBO0935619.1 hypothetical protein [Fibrella rubiginis]
MKRLLPRLLFFCLFILSTTHSLSSYAHVGSAGVVVQKRVGNYQLLISVQPPDVVPGTAQVTVYVEKGRVTSIVGRPVFFFEGDEGSPEAEALKAVGNDRYEGAIWFMQSGSTSVELTLNGPDGKAELVIPMMANSTATREMPAGTGAGLAVMGLLLVAMLITIIGASNADGVSKPGDEATKKLGRRRLAGMVVGGVVLVMVLSGGRMWWNSWADEYRTYQLYKPVPLISKAIPDDKGQVVLTMQPDTTGFSKNWQRRRDFNLLVPDHGKLMHTFLVRMPGMDAFAHLHATRRDSLHFEARLPNLPGGRYLLFTDVVYRSGYAETLTDTVDIPAVKVSAAQAALRTVDPDDSYLLTEPMGVKQEAVGKLHLDNDMVACGKPGASTRLTDGSTMIWTDKPSPILNAGELYTLKFAVADPAGKAAKLEPYLGMGGHAAILRSDGTVYIHLHPVGTYSMASETMLVNRIADTSRTAPRLNGARFRDSIDTYLTQFKAKPETEKNAMLALQMPGMDHGTGINNMVTFPYAFPRPGHYRIWVQVKRNGQVQTGVFDTQVK